MDFKSGVLVPRDSSDTTPENVILSLTKSHNAFKLLLCKIHTHSHERLQGVISEGGFSPWGITSARSVVQFHHERNPSVSLLHLYFLLSSQT